MGIGNTDAVTILIVVILIGLMMVGEHYFVRGMNQAFPVRPVDDSETPE